MRMTHCRTAAGIRSSRGTTLLEILIGLTVGLFVVAGGLAMLANFTGENRRLLLETRLAQDLRAASDLITRDIRRAGYWTASTSSVWTPGGPAVPPQNAYRAFIPGSCDASPLAAAVPSPAASASALCYYVEQDTNNAADASDRYGFKLQSGVIYAMLAGGAAQPLTDPNTITISDFVMTPRSQALSAAGFCKSTCTVNCPRVVVREFEVLIKGNVPGNATINRFIRSDVRVRNDYYDGQCPT